VLLGGMHKDALQALYDNQDLSAHSASTPTSVIALKQLVDRDYQRGYGVSQGGFEAGISTIAAPVFDARRMVCAAISVTVPASEIEPQKVEALVLQVQHAAQQLTQRLSHSPASTHSPQSAHYSAQSAKA
jgi:DNA-binding IclR family transcriptional regulator